MAITEKQFWQRRHLEIGCLDVSPRYFKKLRDKRILRNILIFATGGIGDSLWVMPFARALKQKHPSALIVVITEPRNQPLWENLPYIAALSKPDWQTTANFMHKSDEAYDFGGVATFLKKEMRLDPVEAIFKMGDLPLPMTKAQCRPEIALTVEEGITAQKLLEKYKINVGTDKVVTIGANASTPNRDWPLDHMTTLARNLSEKGFKVICLGDRESYTSECLSENQNNVLTCNLINKTSLRSAAAIIAQSDIFIGPNSALMVIATAVGTPTIGLFGAFNPTSRAKFYDRFDYIWGRTNCAPCNEHWTECRMGSPAPCMKIISPEEVEKKIFDMLRRWPKNILERLPMR
jgi:ADP-heptose:LPS heptosyltransferase